MYVSGADLGIVRRGFFAVQTSHCSSDIEGWGCISTEHAHWEWEGSQLCTKLLLISGEAKIKQEMNQLKLGAFSQGGS